MSNQSASSQSKKNKITVNSAQSSGQYDKVKKNKQQKTKESTKKQSMLNTHRINPFKYDMNQILEASSMDPAKASSFLASVIAKASRVSTKNAKEFVKTFLENGDLTKEEADKINRLLDKYSKYRRGNMDGIELGRGRIFVLRLRDGEVLHETIESFCKKNGIKSARLGVVGAADKGSMMVSGPTVPIEGLIRPRIITLEEKCEITGFGTVFPDEEGNPVAHIHGSVGREGFSATGDFRPKMIAWLVVEVIVEELTGDGPVRKKSDSRIDGKLLEIE